MALAITWGTLAAAGFAGLGLGIGIVLGVAILRWVRRDSGNHRGGTGF